MLDFTNAESPLGRQSESFEEFRESLNKFKEEEGTSSEACMQGSWVEAPLAPPPPIPQASGRQPQRAKQFVNAVQAQAQEAKHKAKQAPKPKFKPSGLQSKKRKKVPSPDDSGDKSSPIFTDASEDSDDSPHPSKPPPTETLKVKQKSKEPLKKTKKADGAPNQSPIPRAPRTTVPNDRWRRRRLHRKTKDPHLTTNTYRKRCLVQPALVMVQPVQPPPCPGFCYR